MVRLETQRHFRPVQRLPFCYLCGQAFAARKDRNRDHVPPKCTFAKSDREPLILPSHVTCNRSYELLDEKVGQFIALRRREVADPDNDRLRFALSPDMKHGALINVDVDGAVWRWIKGFHAALYGETTHLLRSAACHRQSIRPSDRHAISPRARA